MSLHIGFGRYDMYLGLWPRGTFAGGLSWLDYGRAIVSHGRWGIWLERAT